jgi:NADH dehydrogenase [ubiquinone] 1 alpha subcomplex assembly factor 7
VTEGFAARFARSLQLEGPQPVSRLMAEAIAHYYGSRDPFGAAGDFVTAPEVSQMFGELIGLWAADLWDRMGRPAPLRLVELGPGRGTLMRDALRAVARAMPACRAALDIHLVETSPTLQRHQRATLGDAAVTWHDDLTSVPDGPMFAVANEFLDALPIRQLVRSEHGWHERLVAAGDTGALHFALSPALPHVPDLSLAHRAAPVGSLVELSPARGAVVEVLARRLAAEGGAALLIDYGSARSGTGDTLQALQAHRPVDILATLGGADLTSHVDFEPLAAIARHAGAGVFGPVPQGAFLEALGIAARATALKRSSPSHAAAIESETARLIAPDAMGRLFLVMGIAGPGMPPLAGFQASG